MNELEERLRDNLEELKTYFANIFFLLEQALSLDPDAKADALIEINSKIQALMTVVAQKSITFQQAIQHLNERELRLDRALREEIDDFCGKIPDALRNLIEQLGSSRNELENKREVLKAELLRLQQSHKGLAGYKTQAKHPPKFFDSTI